jgi:hypothetical protein
LTIPYPSDRVLAELPPRATRFLHAIATQAELAAAMASIGYGAEAHAEGLRLLGAALHLESVPHRSAPEPSVRERLERIERWVRQALPRYAIAAVRTDPEWARRLFGDASAHDGDASSVATLRNLLDRLDEADALGGPAVEALAARGLTRDERARLRADCEAAMRGVAPRAEGAGRVDREAELRALWAWFYEWRLAARSAIARKDWLILLGIGQRKRAGAEGDDEAAAPAAE